MNQSYKIYSIDGEPQNPENDKKAILAAAARRRDAGQNDRYYNEVREQVFERNFAKIHFQVEKERRIRKRRSRLEAAVDDAFSLVHRQASSNMAASDVADEVWPTMARSMQKYLRTTR